jgi:hypothetical protein
MAIIGKGCEIIWMKFGTGKKRWTTILVVYILLETTPIQQILVRMERLGMAMRHTLIGYCKKWINCKTILRIAKIEILSFLRGCRVLLMILSYLRQLHPHGAAAITGPSRIRLFHHGGIFQLFRRGKLHIRTASEITRKSENESNYNN